MRRSFISMPAPLLIATLVLQPACTGAVTAPSRTPPAVEVPAPDSAEPAGERRTEWPWIAGGALIAGAIVFAGIIAAVVIVFERGD